MAGILATDGTQMNTDQGLFGSQHPEHGLSESATSVLRNIAGLQDRRSTEQRSTAAAACAPFEGPFAFALVRLAAAG